MSFTSSRYDFANKEADYTGLAAELEALLEGEPDLIANAANTSALLFDVLPDVNWVGFYFLRGSAATAELVVGPFQGKPACVRIALGTGVCGTAAARRTTMVVQDVHAFPGHIACDAASRSEIVIPLIKDGHLFGVLDLDSPSVARFDDADRQGLERVATILVSRSVVTS